MPKQFHNVSHLQVHTTSPEAARFQLPAGLMHLLVLHYHLLFSLVHTGTEQVLATTDLIVDATGTSRLACALPVLLRTHLLLLLLTPMLPLHAQSSFNLPTSACFCGQSIPPIVRDKQPSLKYALVRLKYAKPAVKNSTRHYLPLVGCPTANVAAPCT